MSNIPIICPKIDHLLLGGITGGCQFPETIIKNGFYHFKPDAYFIYYIAIAFTKDLN